MELSSLIGKVVENDDGEKDIKRASVKTRWKSEWYLKHGPVDHSTCWLPTER